MLSGNFHYFSAFWHMGGYALYVWPAYGIAAVVLVWQGFRARAKQVMREIRQLPYEKTP